MYNSAESVAAYATASRLTLLTVAVEIVAAVLAILVVRSIVARQDGLAAAGDGVALPPPPPRPDLGDRGDAQDP